ASRWWTPSTPPTAARAPPRPRPAHPRPPPRPPARTEPTPGRPSACGRAGPAPRRPSTPLKDDANVRRHTDRQQRTLGRPAEGRGVGSLTGADVRLRSLPAPPSSGVVFVRTDLRPRATVAAHIDQVTGTRRRTTLGHPPAQVGLVEHVLAALAGLR